MNYPSPRRQTLFTIFALIISILTCVRVYQINPYILMNHKFLTPFKLSSKNQISNIQFENLSELKTVTLYPKVIESSFPQQNPNEAKIHYNFLRKDVFSFSKDHEDKSENQPLWTYDGEFSYVLRPQYLYMNEGINKPKWKFKSEKQNFKFLPLITSDVLFLASSKGKIFALNKSNGNVLWRTNFYQKIDQPLYKKDKHLFVVSQVSEGSLIHYIDINTGKVKQSFEVKKQITTPLSSVDKEDRLYWGNIDGELVSYSIQKKKILWSFTSGAKIIHAPYYMDSSLYFLNEAGKVFALTRNKGTENWQHQLSGPSHQALRFIPQYNYITAVTDNNYVHAIKVKDGEGLWRFNTKNTQPLKGILPVRLNSEAIMKFHMKWVRKGWSLWAPCGQRSLCIFNPDKGQVINRLHLQGQAASLPVFKAKKLYISMKKAIGLSHKKEEKITPPEWYLGSFQ